jgi:hypothetical protein
VKKLLRVGLMPSITLSKCPGMQAWPGIKYSIKATIAMEAKEMVFIFALQRTGFSRFFHPRFF